MYFPFSYSCGNTFFHGGGAPRGGVTNNPEKKISKIFFAPCTYWLAFCWKNVFWGLGHTPGVCGGGGGGGGGGGVAPRPKIKNIFQFEK
jgi:hypothetical protein